MSIKTESAKLKNLKDQSIRLIKKIIANKSTHDSEDGGAGGGGSTKDGLDSAKKGVSGPLITGKGNFDDLILFLIDTKAPIDGSMKTKLGDVYKLINGIPLTPGSIPAPVPPPVPSGPTPTPIPPGPVGSGPASYGNPDIKSLIPSEKTPLVWFTSEYNTVKEKLSDPKYINTDILANGDSVENIIISFEEASQMVVNDKFHDQKKTDKTFLQNDDLMKKRKNIIKISKYSDEVKNHALQYIDMILNIVTPIIK
jgi:hypothetical protein